MLPPPDPHATVSEVVESLETIRLLTEGGVGTDTVTVVLALAVVLPSVQLTE